jgi:hypothetical protein
VVKNSLARRTATCISQSQSRPGRLELPNRREYLIYIVPPVHVHFTPCHMENPSCDPKLRKSLYNYNICGLLSVLWRLVYVVETENYVTLYNL